MIDTLAALRAIVATVLPDLSADEIVAGDNLRDLGANSVDRLDILSAVIEEFDLPVSMTDTTGLHTIGQILEFVAARCTLDVQ